MAPAWMCLFPITQPPVQQPVAGLRVPDSRKLRAGRPGLQRLPAAVMAPPPDQLQGPGLRLVD